MKPPDLLVLDLMMPDMDGYVVLEEMPVTRGNSGASVVNLLERSKEELRLRREDLKDKARLPAQLESVVEQGHQTA